MNTLRNLIVVCEKCHDAHHAGELEIGPMKQTSEGPVREVTRPVAPRPAAGGLTEQEIATVQAELRAYPTLPASRMIFDLEERHGIRITAQRLRTIRASIVTQE
jgi:hypothetical protein